MSDCVDETPDYVENQTVLRSIFKFKHITKLKNMTIKSTNHDIFANKPLQLLRSKFHKDFNKKLLIWNSFLKHLLLNREKYEIVCPQTTWVS